MEREKGREKIKCFILYSLSKRNSREKSPVRKEKRSQEREAIQKMEEGEREGIEKKEKNTDRDLEMETGREREEGEKGRKQE